MKTIIEDTNDLSIKKAAEIIKSGGLVAFPTETVYGLGADAFNAEATKKIYEAKGRPSDNPLILHIGSLENIYDLVERLDSQTEKLIQNFWPGPLTIILNKKVSLSDKISNGLDTIAIRFPINPVAQKLINLSGVPIAAPSANVSGKPSCTKSKHVINDLNGKIDMILCDDSSSFGLESTIIDMTVEVPTILRPGVITFEMISEILPEVNNISVGNVDNDTAPKAPGMKYKHYSPKADVFIFVGDEQKVCAKINDMIAENKKLKDESLKVGVLACDQTKGFYDKKECVVLSVGDRENLFSVAENLFSVLRMFDLCNVDVIYSESFPQNGVGSAVMNRLSKAAGYKFINVS